MKIAFLDANPRICGPMSWIQHLSYGLTSLGHSVEVISSTKSGRVSSSWGKAKWGGQWSVHAPTLTVRNRDLPDALDEYDYVILPEPKVPSHDKEALKTGGLPPYVAALIRTRTPFSTALHGNNYDLAAAPFIERICSADAFTGLIVSHSERSHATLPHGLTQHLNVVPSVLPYRPKLEIDADLPPLDRVGTTGRFMYNKGAHIVAMAAVEGFPHSVEFELWGAATIGLGTNVTYAVYEALLPFAEEYNREGDQAEKLGQPNATEHGNTIRPYLWSVRMRNDGPLVSYKGNYVDPVATAGRLTVHVNLTGQRFSGGLVEYSTLEAMDAGSLCIAPQHVSDNAFHLMRTPLVDPPGSVVSLAKHPDVTTGVRDKILAMLALTRDHPEAREHMVRANRTALRDYSDPIAVARLFLAA